MRPQEIIRKKRDGAALTQEEIAAFVAGVTSGGWADYQISALLMACFTRGLNADEAAHLTQEMLHSGEVLDFSDIDAPKADKHSTGGVGDKTSLIIAPLAAACGAAVPMISGRGLGHTGGTLDKLESIAGYNVNLSLAEFKKIIKKCGFAMTGQTAEIAPADKKLYALRDATATVEYIPLIVASIMSKKLAEGLDALVLDVKTGNGAFMPEFERAKELAEAMCRTGISCNVATQAVISDMNQPLGKYVGNALEVYECIKIMRGEMETGFEQTVELSIELTARMLTLTGIAKDLDAAKALCQTKLRDGSALQKLQQNIELQGGDPRICDQPEALLDKNLLKIQIKSPRSGFITEINTKLIGEAISDIGGGRIKVEDQIDFQVGFASETRIGDFVEENQIIGILYCREENKAPLVFEKLINSFVTAELMNTMKNTRLIKEFISLS
jgi:pyrimidine-nucleoside phosphorylase